MGKDPYLIPDLVSGVDHRVEDSIKRSRFITSIGHAPDSETAKQFVERIRSEFSDATHNCWGFAAGPPGDTAQVGMSDDGEPHGTAGRPILNALLHSEVGEVVAVVTRYYGGVKLGKGGLGRAYSGGVALALASLPTTLKITWLERTIKVGYASADGLRRALPEIGAVIRDEQFGEAVTFSVGVPEELLETLEQRVADITNGEGRVAE